MVTTTEPQVTLQQPLQQQCLNDGHDSKVTQESDLEQEDSETSLTEDEDQ